MDDGGILFRQHHCIGTVRGLQDTIAIALQNSTSQLSDGILILDNQHRLRSPEPPRGSGSLARLQQIRLDLRQINVKSRTLAHAASRLNPPPILMNDAVNGGE